MAGEPVLFGTREAAAVLGVTPRTVDRWVHEGRIKPARRVGSAYVYTPEEVARVAALPKRKRGPARKPKQNSRLPLDGVA